MTNIKFGLEILKPHISSRHLYLTAIVWSLKATKNPLKFNFTLHRNYFHWQADIETWKYARASKAYPMTAQAWQIKNFFLRIKGQ